MAATAWHARPAHEVLAALSTDPSGLSETEAAARLERHGPNRLAPPVAVSALRILVDQLKGIVVVLLIAAALVSLVLGDRLEAAAIAAVLVINTILGFMTELRARRAMDALLQFESSRATVKREGRLRVIEAQALVPGDIVQLDAGQRLPADGRLIQSADLQVDEAPLTGESMPVSKRADGTIPEDTPQADRTNMVYKGTTVMAGSALAVVTETGAATEIGRIGALVGSIRESRTPLERRLDALGRRLVWLALGVAVLVSALGALQGASSGLVIKTGIALAVAAVPESLPAVATIALAVGLHRMARRQALVRRLPAVEALGSTTVVCTDKTRTLTSGRMTVVRIWSPDERSLLEAAALASRPQPGAGDEGPAGDPVDAALLAAGRHAGVDRARLVEGRPQAGWIPFSSDRKLMASFHRAHDGLRVYVKGAPGRILGLSRFVLGPEGEEVMDDDSRQRLEDVNRSLAADGLRVLAVASGPADRPEESALTGLTFMGFVGLADPPAPGVKETIAKLRRAGLRTVMLTGDQRLTAQAVGRELGLLAEGEAVIDVRELDALPAAELEARLSHAGAFSRITSEHKLMLVKRLQERGEIVAMLGDGVNDAPALRQADIGVAMGRRGTDVAREAAAIVLQDDRFETVAVAVEEGRVIFDNIRKFVFYLFSCNVAEVLVLLCAGVAGLPLPLLPLQILWLNMVTDTFPALALALEPGDDDLMNRPPRNPKEAVLSPRFLGRVGFYGLLITVVSLVAFVTAPGGASGESARTMVFMTLAFAQILHLGNARSTHAVLHPRRAGGNPFAIAAVALSTLLQLAALYVPPLAALLGLTPLILTEWMVVAGLAAVPAVVGQAAKLWRQRQRSVML